MDEQPTRWHESLGAVLVMLIIAAIVTAPCWGLALLLAVR